MHVLLHSRPPGRVQKAQQTCRRLNRPFPCPLLHAVHAAGQWTQSQHSPSIQAVACMAGTCAARDAPRVVTGSQPIGAARKPSKVRMHGRGAQLPTRPAGAQVAAPRYKPGNHIHLCTACVLHPILPHRWRRGRRCLCAYRRRRWRPPSAGCAKALRLHHVAHASTRDFDGFGCADPRTSIKHAAG